MPYAVKQMGASRESVLRLRGHELEISSTPLLMGILNATPDSFSDARRERDGGTRVERGLAMRAAGADLIDVGGESGSPTARRSTPATRSSASCR